MHTTQPSDMHSTNVNTGKWTENLGLAVLALGFAASVAYLMAGGSFLG